MSPDDFEFLCGDVIRQGPFHLIYTPPYGREFLRGFEKAVSEGLCASASFHLCVFSEGRCLCRHFDLFFLGVQILLTSSIGGCVH
jgi:hypothetical protein